MKVKGAGSKPDVHCSVRFNLFTLAMIVSATMSRSCLAHFFSHSARATFLLDKGHDDQKSSNRVVVGLADDIFLFCFCICLGLTFGFD